MRVRRQACTRFFAVTGRPRRLMLPERVPGAARADPDRARTARPEPGAEHANSARTAGRGAHRTGWPDGATTRFPGPVVPRAATAHRASPARTGDGALRLPCRDPRPMPVHLRRASSRPRLGAARLVAAVLLLGAGCLLGWAPPSAALDVAGGWSSPLAPPLEVARPFDRPAGPFSAGHRGVDLVATEGAVVRAAGAGTVVLAGTVAGHEVVVVAHGAGRSVDELRTTYEPVVPSVGLGEQVRRGDPLGRLAPWPEHCGPRTCLHWGLRRGSAYLDPLALLHGAVRLLPTAAAQGADAVAPVVAPTVVSTTVVSTVVSTMTAADSGRPRPHGPARVGVGALAATLLLGGGLAGAARSTRVPVLRRRPRPRGSSP